MDSGPVADLPDEADPRMVGEAAAHHLEDARTAFVRGAVVDEDDLPSPADFFKNGHELIVQGPDVVLLVVDGDDDGNPRLLALIGSTSFPLLPRRCVQHAHL